MANKKPEVAARERQQKEQQELEDARMVLLAHEFKRVQDKGRTFGRDFNQFTNYARGVFLEMLENAGLEEAFMAAVDNEDKIRRKIEEAGKTRIIT